jgi:hypothetical protein
MCVCARNASSRCQNNLWRPRRKLLQQTMESGKWVETRGLFGIKTLQTFACWKFSMTCKERTFAAAKKFVWNNNMKLTDVTFDVGLCLEQKFVTLSTPMQAISSPLSFLQWSFCAHDRISKHKALFYILPQVTNVTAFARHRSQVVSNLTLFFWRSPFRSFSSKSTGYPAWGLILWHFAVHLDKYRGCT